MADARAGSVAVHQLVYGSAAKLLAPGASDLGVIASTRGFPQDATRRLLTHRSYSVEAAESARPIKYIVGMLGRYVEVTRIEMGIDHTGRSLAFAHHVLVEDAALRRADMSVGQCICEASAVCASPRGFTAGSIEPQATLSGTAPKADVAIDPEVIAAMAAAVIRYPAEKRPVVLVAPRPTATDPAGDPFLPVLAAVADVLPAPGLAAFVAATHVVTKDDRLAEASIVCTYPGTPFQREMSGRSGSRAPLIVDLTTGRASAAADSNDPLTRATIADLKAGESGRFSRLCDQFSATPDQYGIVAELSMAASRVADKPTLANLEALAAAVEKGKPLANRPRLLDWVAGVLTGMVRQKWPVVAKDVASQQHGPARLAKVVSSSEAALELMARAGAQCQVRGMTAEADVAAEALESLGARGKAIGRQVGDREKSPGFTARFSEQPRQEPIGDDTPATRAALPGAKRGASDDTRVRHVGRRASGMVPVTERSWRADEPTSGGMLIPRLLLLVAIGAMLIPAIKEYASLDGKSSLEDTIGVARDVWRAIVGAVTNRHWDFLIPGMLLVAVAGLMASYASLSNLLVTRLGAPASLIPTVVLAAAALASVCVALYPPRWPAPEAGKPAATTEGDRQRGRESTPDEKAKP